MYVGTVGALLLKENRRLPKTANGPKRGGSHVTLANHNERAWRTYIMPLSRNWKFLAISGH